MTKRKQTRYQIQRFDPLTRQYGPWVGVNVQNRSAADEEARRMDRKTRFTHRVREVRG